MFGIHLRRVYGCIFCERWFRTWPFIQRHMDECGERYVSDRERQRNGRPT